MSLPTLIRDAAPDEAALLAVSAPPLSYAGLGELMDRTSAALAQMGIEHDDRVALVASNGPEMAAAFLGIAASCGCAPLNPGYREEEFRFYLEDLKPSLLVIEQGMGEAAAAAAAALGIRVRRLLPEPHKGAGWFGLEGAGEGGEPRYASPESTALYLHTSGTTNRPKLVPLTQYNLLCSAANVARTLALSPADRCLNVMPLFHIHGLIAAVLASLSAGASVVCSPGFQVTRFFDWMDEFEPTWYTAVPTMHQVILERAALDPERAKRARLRFVRSSSASLPPQVMERLEEVFRAPVVEAYGMTEAAHQMACNPLPPLARKPGAVGLPAGPEVAVMDAGGRLLAQGERGEIVIRGPNVTAGYEANPEANRTAYCEGWFRTGDEGYFDADGYLFLTGRLKEMINRGGEKIAPREIDEALMEHPAVAQALAFGAPDPKLGEEVAAAVVLKPGASARESELQDFLAAKLADFKIPRLIVFLEKIPKGPTGKMQRVGLASRLGIENIHHAPAAADGEATALAGALAGIWTEVLRRDDITAQSHFFDCGGDSILAAQAVGRVNTLTGRALNVMHLFRAPTPGALGAWLEANPGEAQAPPAPGPSADPSKLSPAQERMLFLHSYEEEPALYNRPALLRLRGAVDGEALREALDDVVKRHEAFRTCFQAEDNGWSASIAAAAACPLETHDLRARADSRLKTDELTRELLSRPFDLCQPPLLRVALLQVEDEEYRLAVSMHHVISDGWSSRVFFRDLCIAYAARRAGVAPVFEPLRARYADYVAWLEQRLSGERRGQLEAYWKGRLEGAPPLLEVPTDFPRPARATFTAGVERLTLPAQLTARLREIARGSDATLFMVLLAGFQALLARTAGLTDVVIGTPSAGRTRPGFEPLAGLFGTTLPLRCDLSGNPSFHELVVRARECSLEAIAHQDLPFEKLVDVLRLQRNLSHPPLVQVTFQLRNVPLERAGLSGCATEEMECHSGLSPMDLNLEATETPDGLTCRLDYRRDLFRPETAQALLAGYRSLLTSAATDIDRCLGDLALTGGDDAHENSEFRRGPAREIGRPIVDDILETARRNPGRTLFCCAGRSLTYGAYLDLALRIAGRIQDAGIRPGSRVALLADRCVEAPTWLLGIWLAGCCSVPIDPSAPPKRAAFMLRDSGAQAVLVQSLLAATLVEAAVPVIALESLPQWRAAVSCGEIHPGAGACVVYTSGSTGQPKGVEITHKSLRNVLDWLAREVGLRQDDVFVNAASYAFDASFADYYLAPALGAVVHIPDSGEIRDGQRLAALFERVDATYTNATPTTFVTMLESGWRGCPRLSALSGGEALTPQVAAALLPRVRTLWNVYGPSETTDISAACRVLSAEPPISIGLPVDNTTLHVLDKWGRPAIAGFPGELHISGAGVAEGYINRPELTAERFVFLDTPAGPIRTYRTGDLVRSLRAGGLEFLGRMDQQIKLRGHRIELGEIEAALQVCPGIAAAVVVLQEHPADRIAAFYCGTAAHAPTPDELRAALRASLPEHMVPALIRRVDALPLTTSGKIDRKALAALDAGQEGHSGARGFTPLESDVAACFTEVLARRDIGPDDDFFDLGGHSLAAVRLMNRLMSRFGAAPTIREFFCAATVRDTAARIQAREKETAG
ncbi:MAG: amino acid adenylation domain-containing protein [Candidatus Solibacter usitatus]|nr:amino acid adenylation domain-containing protein [Candidatus Solibacter usitatus]